MKRVVIIDDEEEICELLAEMLSFSSFEVVSFTSSLKARDYLVSKTNASDVDAVISDMNMPGMDGLQLMSETRKHGLSIPFILFSGHMDNDQSSVALQAGAACVLNKPIATEKIVSTLKQILSY